MKEELIRIVQNLDDYHIRVILAFVKRIHGVGH